MLDLTRERVVRDLVSHPRHVAERGRLARTASRHTADARLRQLQRESVRLIVHEPADRSPEARHGS
jgi:hypothetical protein